MCSPEAKAGPSYALVLLTPNTRTGPCLDEGSSAGLLIYSSSFSAWIKVRRRRMGMTKGRMR